MSPAANSAWGSSSSVIGSRDGKYRTFSSNSSKTPSVSQCSPNHTRGRTPWLASSSVRVSAACSNSAMRVSWCRSLPRKNGLFAASATSGPDSTCAAFQKRAKSSGATCRCSWKDVHAASNRIEFAMVSSSSSPSM